jgi:antibiotic biosynthesis monooxygenase (ABM) superfamily enzyme
MPATNTDQAPPTRIITYHVRPGKENEFKALNDLAKQAAQKHPGYIGSETLPPSANNSSDEWVVIYRFENNETLNTWLESPERKKVILDAHDIFTSSPSEYSLRDGSKSSDHEMTIVTTHTIVPGKEEEYKAANKTLNDAAARFPGFAGCEIFEPTSENPQSTVLIRFNNKENMDRWLNSKERESGREALYKTTIDHHTNVVGTGFGSWFAFNAEAGVSAAAWKQAMVVLSVLFPVVMTLNLTVGKILDQNAVPFAFNVFTGNTLGTITLTWIAMPTVSRLMDWWLSPRCRSKRTVLGILFLIAIYATELTIFKMIS